VPIPKRDGDFVFFVSYGRKQGEHRFDEGVTSDGVLSWQSQPQQNFKNKQIRQFINHDEDKNSVYLFLRNSLKGKYLYLGRLKYLTHDKKREKPVFFQWQILDWHPPIELLKQVAYNPDSSGDDLDALAGSREKNNHLELIDVTFLKRDPLKEGVDTDLFQKFKKPDYAKQDANNRRLGELGELLVMEYERQFLLDRRKDSLAAKIKHVSKEEGDGAGYDILSYDIDGKEKFIEVKTTRGGLSTSFYLTSTEINRSTNNPNQFYLYRVFDFDITANTGKMYIIKGHLDDAIVLKPISYRAEVLPQQYLNKSSNEKIK
jgi:hypothetical protein